MRDLSLKYNVNKSTIKKTQRAIKNKESFCFGLSGKMGSGKDTVGEEVASKLRSNGYEITQYSFATPLREEIDGIVKSVNDVGISATSKKYNADKMNVTMLVHLLDGKSIYERSPEARKALQYWGTEYRRRTYANYWVDRVAEFLSKELSQGKSCYITDARFPNEVELIEDFGDAVIRLEVSTNERIKRISKRDGFKPSNETLSHSSESLLDNYNFKYVIKDDILSPSAVSDIIISDILKKENKNI